jgi:xanthine phosphoribosyltransferase
MSDKSFEAVKLRLEEITFEEPFDLIVAIANGGIVPAALLNQKLGLDLQLLNFDVQGKTILLVEDRVKTGNTLNFAKDLLLEAGAKTIKTFAVNGKADYCLYDELCFRFPWILEL